MKIQNSEVESKLVRHGASLVGFADINSLPFEVTGGFPRAVSIARALEIEIVREISNGPTRKYYEEYKRINYLLEQICEQAVEFFAKMGKRAESFEATTDDFDQVTLSTRIQHKTIATRAGLGWIGKSALLVTKEFGPAVRLATVFTDAEFEVAEPVGESQCGQCRRCLEKCPAGAILGQNWNAGASRESIYDAFACRNTAHRLSKAQGIDSAICGICINVCPWTQKYISRELTS
jgi:epoxyqueuosine reductase